MDGCDLLFNPETAAKVRGQVRANLGGECPCDRGEPCPLLPADFAERLIPLQRETRPETELHA